jgi:hypothetical protein
VRKKYLFVFFYFLFFNKSFCQELFPTTETASTLPKNALSTSLFFETYKEYSQQRFEITGQVYYGLTPRLTIGIGSTVSNHHGDELPNFLLNHTHVGNRTIYLANANLFGYHYPFLFDGVNFNFKYRLFSRDGFEKHFRIAFVGDYTVASIAHDEAEPDLHGDNAGISGGIIATKLIHRFAVSTEWQYILPFTYKEDSFKPPLTSTPNFLQLYYGKAIDYSVSFGYRIYPSKYSDFNQVNYNVFIELKGAHFDTARVYQFFYQSDTGLNAQIISPGLIGKTYLDACFGFQQIVGSNDRINLTITVPVFHRSYSHFYPYFDISYVRNFYL